MTSEWQCWFDGTAAPNPGRMGIGIVLIAPDGRRFERSVRAPGVGCNNEAELIALKMALEWALEMNVTSLRVQGDSQLAIEVAKAGKALPPVIGPSRFRAVIDPLHAMQVAFDTLEFRWIPRHRNGDADRLARAAIGLPEKPPSKPDNRARSKRTRRRK